MQVTKIHVYKLEKDQVSVFKEMLLLFEKVFAEKHGFDLPDSHKQEILAQDGFIAMAAIDNEKVVGALTAYILPSYYSEKPFIYLFDLAVDNSARRQGIGSLLLNKLREYGKKIGAAEMFVQADLEDQHAINFYVKNGGKAESVVHFTYPL